MTDLSITTTSGFVFTEKLHRELARLIRLRFGNDDAATCAAWRRMLQNNSTDEDILKLLRPEVYRMYKLRDGQLVNRVTALSMKCTGPKHENGPCVRCQAEQDDYRDHLDAEEERHR